MSAHLGESNEVSTPPTLSAALSSKKTNGLFTAAFVDIVGSLQRMVQQPAATWMGEQEFVYRTVVDCLHELELLPHIAVVDWEGDAAVIVVDSSKAAELMNAMIMLMEKLAQAAQKPVGHYSGEVAVQMRCGMATGELLRFTTPTGGIDFTGPAMAVASRLCSLGSPNAILVDVNTVETANMGLVRSQLGTYRRRTAAQYRGDQQAVPVKGIENPLPYHEIIWEESPFGLASTAVTETTKPTPPTTPPHSPRTSAIKPRTESGPEKAVGKIKVWLKDKGYGFITGQDGEEFYLSTKGLVYSEDAEMLASGTEVAFTIAAPLREGAARRAVTTLVSGADADGKLAYRNSAKGFGFITVTDSFGAAISVHIQIPESSTWQVGTELAFTVATSPRGPRAVNPEIVTDDEEEGGGPLRVVGVA